MFKFNRDRTKKKTENEKKSMLALLQIEKIILVLPAFLCF